MQAPVDLVAEDMISVPRVFIHIPGMFSKPKFEPEYVLPLFAEVWRSAITDPTDPVAIKPWPAELCNRAGVPDPVFGIARIPADDPCKAEERRLRGDFGSAVFERVYPGSEFKRTFAEFMRANAPAVPAKK